MGLKRLDGHGMNIWTDGLKENLYNFSHIIYHTGSSQRRVAFKLIQDTSDTGAVEVDQLFVSKYV